MRGILLRQKGELFVALHTFSSLKRFSLLRHFILAYVKQDPSANEMCLAA